VVRDMVIPNRVYRRFISLLFAILAMLGISSLLSGAVVISRKMDSGVLYRLFQLLNLDFERNVPTWFSAMLLTVNGLTLLLIAYHTKALERRYFLHWLFLGGVFFMLSMDEFVQFHEQVIRPIREMLNTDRFLYNAWIIPAGIAVLVLGIFYLPLVFSLPRSTRNTFLIAGFLYVGAVLGIEAIGGCYFSTTVRPLDAQYDLVYLLITHVEELLELTGVILFMHGLFNYLHEINTAHDVQSEANALLSGVSASH